MKKTISELIDELSIINIKIALLVEKVDKNKHTLEDAFKIHKLNRKRSQLKNAINEFFNEVEEIKT